MNIGDSYLIGKNTRICMMADRNSRRVFLSMTGRWEWINLDGWLVGFVWMFG